MSEPDRKREPETLAEVLDTIAATQPDAETDAGAEAVSIGKILDQFDSRSYGPLLLIVALIAVGPTGAIPGMSIVTGCLVIAISVQMLLGRGHVWIPRRAETFNVTKEKLGALVARAKPATAFVDKFIWRRWAVLVEGPALYVLGVACIVLALTMFPLALLPFAVAIPGTAIGLFGLALTARDGVLAALAYVVMAAAVYAFTLLL